MEYIQELAGAQRTPYSVRLRRASELLRAELDEGLLPLERLFVAKRARPGDAAEAVELLRHAEWLGRAAVEFVAEAALRGAGVAATLREALLEPPDAALEATALRETLYLARCGQEPFRRLAAYRLGGAAGGPARSTLAQLLYDRSPRVAAIALASLLASGAEWLTGTLASTFRNLQDDGGEETAALRAVLLMELAELDPEEAAAVAAEALEYAGSPELVRQTAMRVR